MAPRRVFVTGATGSVGARIVRTLLDATDASLLLLVRDASRLPATVRDDPRVTLLVCDLDDAHRHGAVIGEADALVLAATAWGDDATRTNLDAYVRLLDAIPPARGPHVIYFSSASVLARDGSMLREAESLGTPYIRSKAAATRALRSRRDRPITILHPTLVIGGGDGAPASHFTRLLRQASRYAWLLGLLSFDGSFHVMSADDIATIVRAVLRDPPPRGSPRSLVLGGPAITADALVDAMLDVVGRRRFARIPVTPAFTKALIAIFRIRLAPWDRYCLGERHFTYDSVVSPASFGECAIHASLMGALSSVI